MTAETEAAALASSAAAPRPASRRWKLERALLKQRRANTRKTAAVENCWMGLSKWLRAPGMSDEKAMRSSPEKNHAQPELRVTVRATSQMRPSTTRG